MGLITDQGMMTLVTVGVIAICAALALHVFYSVTWRAIRRGLREFNDSLTPVAPRLAPEQTMHSMRLFLPHRTSDKVPDYLPTDWT